MKIMTIVGARPQFVKAAVISRLIASSPDIEEILVHTGQHYDHNMSDVFFEEMRIPRPDYNLAVGGKTHGAMTGQMLEKIEELMLKIKPDWTLVYGDTNSTLAGALSAVKLHIPVGHVEAGLRSFNRKMPEEINRLMTDHISDLLFCPSNVSVNLLQNEKVDKSKIHNVGDVMYDAILFYQNFAEPTANTEKIISQNPKYFLTTLHRAENTDDKQRLSSILQALKEIGRSTPIVLPLHPRAKKYVEQFGLNLDGINVIEPVGYFDMISLLKNCQGVLTDSGGLQKEAYFMEKPCITLRDETEWVETVESGCNFVVGARKDAILEASAQVFTKDFNFSQKLYGSGQAGENILSVLQKQS